MKRLAWWGALLALGLGLAPGAAWAQTATEPLGLDPNAVVGGEGRVPFATGRGPDVAAREADELGWSHIVVPGWWHTQGLGRGDRVGWYRYHLRVPQPPPANLAVLLPPIRHSGEAWLNGRLLASDWRDEWLLVPLPRALLNDVNSVLAFKIQGRAGYGGLGAEPLFGPAPKLARRLGASRALAHSGVAVLLAGALILLLLWAENRREPRPLVAAAALVSLATAVFSNSDAWYLVSSSTEWKLRVQHAGVFLAQGFGTLTLSTVLGTHFVKPAQRLAWFAAFCAAATLLGPASISNELGGLTWGLMFVCLLFGLDLTRGLPTGATPVKTGVRGALVACILALIYEVGTGGTDLPGAGVFELALFPLVGTVAAALALRAGRAHLQAARIVEAGRDGLVVLDDLDRIERTNPALQGLLGRSGRDLRMAGLSPSMDAAARGELAGAIGRLQQGGHDGRPEQLELTVRRLEREIQVEVLGVALDDERLLLSFRDLTQRQALEREIARAQRLDSLGMLAGGIAHDFNNLLAGILASGQDLFDLPADEQRRGLAAIVEGAKRGGALTQRLLQFARGRQDSPVGVDLNRALPEAIELMVRTLGRNIEWSLELEPDLPPVPLDRTELEQLLVNLSVNARDAMQPRGGPLSIRAHRVEAASGQPRVAIAVQDGGTGMSRELLERAFEPFVTTKGSGAGTGLGLAVVYGIVTGRGGDVQIESEVGAGTTVTLLLPAAKPPSKSVPAATLPLPPPQLEGARLLLVDDEPALRSFLAHALRRRGFEVETCADGEAAVQWMERQPDGPRPVDAVVMDMMMPVLDGLEASKVLRSRWARLPVVISSGYTGADAIAELEDSGPTLLLGKPYQVEELVEAIGRLCAAAIEESGELPVD